MFQRKDEMTVIDKRIEELTERLRKTRSLGRPQLPPPGANINNNALVQGGVQNGSINFGRPTNGSQQQPWETGKRTDPRGLQSESGRRSPMANGDLSGPPPSNGNGRPGPTNRPMPPKPATLLPPQSFKPRTNQSASSVVPRQGSPMSANRQVPASWHSTSLDAIHQFRGKPEGVNESGSDTSSLTENSSIESAPASTLPNQQNSSQGPNRRPDSRGSPVPHNQRPGSPKASQSSPTSKTDPRLMSLSERRAGSPVPHNQRPGSPKASQSSPTSKTDPRLMSLSERRAGDRTPMYNLASLEAALSPPKEFVDDSGNSQQGEWRQPGYGPGQAPESPSRQAYRNGNHTETDLRTRSASTDSLGSQGRGGSRQPPSPQGKMKPPPPPRSVTTGLSGRPDQPPPGSPSSGAPSAPIVQRYPSVSSQPPMPNSLPSTTTSTHPGSPRLSGGRSSGSSSPVIGPRTIIASGPAPGVQPGSPSTAQPARPSLSTKPSSPVNPDIPPPRPELPQPYSSTSAATDPTRPRHQRSPATVGMFVPPPPAQMRNYNRPSYEQATTSTDGLRGSNSPDHPGKKMNLAAKSLFPNALRPNPPGRTLPPGSQPLPQDDEDSLSPNRPSSPLNLPMSHLYHHPDLQRLRNMPRPLKKRLSYSEDKESMNFLKIGNEPLPLYQSQKPGTLPEQDPTVNDNSQDPSKQDLNKNEQDMNFRNNAILSQKQYTAALSQLSRSPVISNRSSTGKGQVRGILKKECGPKKTIRVRFDPLALLLDASLEGEFELVRRIMPEVSPKLSVMVLSDCKINPKSIPSLTLLLIDHLKPFKISTFKNAYWFCTHMVIPFEQCW